MKRWLFDIAKDKAFVVFETRWVALLPRKLTTNDIDVKRIRELGKKNKDVLLLTKVPFLQSGKLHMTVEYVTNILNKYPDIAEQYTSYLYELRDTDSYDRIRIIYDWYLDTAIELLKLERPDLYEMYANYEITADQRTGILDSNHAYVLRAVVFLAKFMIIPLMYHSDCLSDINCPKLPINPDIIKDYTVKLFGRHDNLYNNILLLIKAIARGRFSGIFEKLEAMNKKSAAEEEAYTLYHLMYSALLQLSEDAQSLGTVTRIIQSKYLVTVRESAQYNIKPIDSINTPISLRLPNITTISHNLREAVTSQAYLLALVKELRQYMPDTLTFHLPLSKDWFINYCILPAFYKEKNVKSAPNYILTEKMLAAVRGYVLDKGLIHQGLQKYLYMIQMPIAIQVTFSDFQQIRKHKATLQKFLDAMLKERTFVYTIRDDKVFLLTKNGNVRDIQFTKILDANGVRGVFESTISLIPAELEDTLVPFLKERVIELIYGQTIDMMTGQAINIDKADIVKQYTKFFIQQFDLEPVLL